MRFGKWDLGNDYWEQGPWMQGLFDRFRAEETGRGFTIWHKQDGRAYFETVCVLRKEGVRGLAGREWSVDQVEDLVGGGRCVGKEGWNNSLGGQMIPIPDGEEPEAEGDTAPAFHGGERCGRPGLRVGHCWWCAPEWCKFGRCVEGGAARRAGVVM